MIRHTLEEGIERVLGDNLATRLIHSRQREDFLSLALHNVGHDAYPAVGHRSEFVLPFALPTLINRLRGCCDALKLLADARDVSLSRLAIMRITHFWERSCSPCPDFDVDAYWRDDSRADVTLERPRIPARHRRAPRYRTLAGPPGPFSRSSLRRQCPHSRGGGGEGTGDQPDGCAVEIGDCGRDPRSI